MSYKAIGFDYGGVINGKPGTTFTHAICEIIGVNPEEYRSAYFAHNRGFNTGTLKSEKALWSAVFTDLDRMQFIDEVMRLSAGLRTGIAINERVLSLVDYLRASGYKVGLLSNNSLSAANDMRAEKLDTHFDVFIVSAEVGLMKPDKEIYTLFADKLGVSLGELIFIDDSTKSLSSAADCGYTPVVFTSYEQLVDQLKNLAILSRDYDTHTNEQTAK